MTHLYVQQIILLILRNTISSKSHSSNDSIEAPATTSTTSNPDHFIQFIIRRNPLNKTLMANPNRPNLVNDMNSNNRAYLDKEVWIFNSMFILYISLCNVFI